MNLDLLRNGGPRTLLVAATAVLCAACAESAKKPSGDTSTKTGTTAKTAADGKNATTLDSAKSPLATKQPQNAKADVKPPVATQVASEGPALKQATDAKTEGEKSANEKEVADEKPADTTAAADGKSPKVDPYAVPDGSPQELLKFMEELSALQPSIKSREELMEHLSKRDKATIAAADKILAGKPDEATRVLALRSKLDASWFIAKFIDPDALPKFRELLKRLANDKDPNVAADARLYLNVIELHSIARDKPGEAKALVAQFVEALSKEPLDKRLPGFAFEVPSMLEEAGYYDLAREAAGQIIAKLKQSKGEDLEVVISLLERTLRLLAMSDKPLDITGTLVDGKRFDWSTYKGKVVLVDFWATWCGPCIAELPNVRKTYLMYHDRGFDVVGVSIDEDRDDLEKFLANEKLPWPTIFDAAAAKSGEKTLAERYGIDSIPAPLLVNKEGIVVSTNARSETLPRLVAELVGPAAGASDKPAVGNPADAKNGAAKP